MILKSCTTQLWHKNFRFRRRHLRAQELCENRGGRPGLPVPNKPYGFCGRKAALNGRHLARRVSEVRRSGTVSNHTATTFPTAGFCSGSTSTSGTLQCCLSVGVRGLGVQGQGRKAALIIQSFFIVQELCESRGGRPGLSVLTSLLVSVDVKNY